MPLKTIENNDELSLFCSVPGFDGFINITFIALKKYNTYYIMTNDIRPRHTDREIMGTGHN